MTRSYGTWLIVTCPTTNTWDMTRWHGTWPIGKRHDSLVRDNTWDMTRRQWDMTRRQWDMTRRQWDMTRRQWDMTRRHGTWRLGSRQSHPYRTGSRIHSIHRRGDSLPCVQHNVETLQKYPTSTFLKYLRHDFVTWDMTHCHVPMSKICVTGLSHIQHDALALWYDMLYGAESCHTHVSRHDADKGMLKVRCLR